MASIFTWESDTPRVSSPWLHAKDVEDAGETIDGPEQRPSVKPLAASPSQRNRNQVLRLQAEPQEGPVEYKLHLLLRPRRTFLYTSTGVNVSGSSRAPHSFDTGSHTVPVTLTTTTKLDGNLSMSNTSTLQTRQHRLQQLTTQLLWRLQQSSPHHTSSATNIIFPAFPEATHELAPPQRPGKLLHGLEESQGALYEIGVSDDGMLIGLAEDELNESLNNLRAMAACLGCTVEVLRQEVVGECQWVDGRNVRQGPLRVAEAFIKPCLQSHDPRAPASQLPQSLAKPIETLSNLMLVTSEQLRVTLTGPTMSGKSSLLGTLTTSTLDTGRGKSRLGMLKHRHEINSGLTSSVTQELLGYQDLPNGDVAIINYATANVASWVDIHAASADNRVVFISDSAGHPRYRRTTIRSLVGWAPHWTFLCISADDGQEHDKQANTTEQASMTGIEAADLAGAQLSLCSNLELPLVIVITKLDLASRNHLRATLSRILSTLKASGRKPVIFPNTDASQVNIFDRIDSALVDRACDVVVPLLNDPIGTVPIILTSAVQGTGISNLHALLHELPIPSYQHQGQPSGAALFHVEDVYARPVDGASTIIVGGHVRSGEVEVGSELVLGPFTTQDQLEDSDDLDERSARRSSRGQLPFSRSFPGALPEIGRFAVPGQEWKHYRVNSIRNLRLPVHALSAGQVGTIAISPVKSIDLPAASRVRKGMVLTPVQPATARTFLAEFQAPSLGDAAVGSSVVIYTASVRAVAKVVSAQTVDFPSNDQDSFTSFALDDGASSDQPETARLLHVTFTFEFSREFIVTGDKVLVMPGGGPALFGGSERGQRDLAGLDGFVGKIVELLS